MHRIILEDKYSSQEQEVFHIDIPDNTKHDVVLERLDKSIHRIEARIGKNCQVDISFYAEQGCNEEINITININENSIVNYDQLLLSNNIREKMNVYLEGKNSAYTGHIGTIAGGHQEYSVYISHNDIETKSQLEHFGVCRDGSITFDVNTYVPKGSHDAEAIQTSKIVVLNHYKGIIKPNLYIDENEVVVHHGASIGEFKENELFYLESRGLKREEAILLLTNAFVQRPFRENKRKWVEKLLEGRNKNE